MLVSWCPLSTIVIFFSLSCNAASARMDVSFPPATTLSFPRVYLMTNNHPTPLHTSLSHLKSLVPFIHSNSLFFSILYIPLRFPFFLNWLRVDSIILPSYKSFIQYFHSLKIMALFLCLLFFLIISSATACDRCVHQSKVAFFDQASDSALKSGACGYGSLALGFNGGYIAAAAPSIYNQGAGCGACFQIRCKNTEICSKQGTKVIVTDLNTSNETEFVLSARAFSAMAQQGKDQEVLKLGIADVEYKRIPCDYMKKKNLGIRVEESSQKPHYLAIKLLYQGGQTEIVAIDVAQVASSPTWYFMSRNHGAIWDTSRVPSGALQFRFVVTAGYDGKYYWAERVLPADWKNGVIYDSGLQITDIAQEPCSPCDDSIWKKEERGDL